MAIGTAQDLLAQTPLPPVDALKQVPACLCFESVLL